MANARQKRRSRRDLASSKVVDAGLCHGSVGAVYFLRRLHASTGINELSDAADRWLAYALAERRIGEGTAGVRVWSKDRWTDNTGLLLGAAGVGLGLLTIGGFVDSSWDRVFGLG